MYRIVRHHTPSLVNALMSHGAQLGLRPQGAVRRAPCGSFASCLLHHMSLVAHPQTKLGPGQLVAVPQARKARLLAPPCMSSHQSLNDGKACEEGVEDEADPVAPWRRQAAEALQRVSTQQFPPVVCGTIKMPYTETDWDIQVAGDGLFIPLNSWDVRKLLNMAKPAPFGRGTETVLNPAIRKAKQIDASLIQVDGQQHIQAVAQQAATELGATDSEHVEARLYKLVIYEKGGHFQVHRDIEKEPGMFGTLVVQLPVEGGHKGGQLAFKHSNKTYQWTPERDEDIHYAAFYADVLHELRPITSGTRAVLVYNLICTSSSQRQVTHNDSVTQDLRNAVAQWENDQTAPRMLCVPLEHKYTEFSLSPKALKGNDITLVDHLAHPDVGLDVHIVLVTKTHTYEDEQRWKKSDGDGVWLVPRYAHNFRHWGYRCGELMGVDYDARVGISAAGAPLDVYPCLDIGRTEGDSYGNTHLDLELIQGGLFSMPGGENTIKFEHGWGLDDDDNDHELDAFRYDDEDEKAVWGCDVGCFWYRDFMLPDSIIHFEHTGNQGGTIDKIYTSAVAIIWPRSQAHALLSKTLPGAVHLLHMRILDGSTEEVQQAFWTVMRMFADAPTSTSPKWNPLKWSPLKDREQWTRTYRAGEKSIAQAVEVISKLGPQVAIPALQIVFKCYPMKDDTQELRQYSYTSWSKFRGYWLKDTSTQCEAMVAAVIKYGVPGPLHDTLMDVVQANVKQHTTACGLLAVAAAAAQSEALSSRIADVVLSHTLLAPKPQQVMLDLPVNVVFSLGTMLCQLPAYRQHLDAWATAVVQRPEAKVLLEALVNDDHIQAAAHHTPSVILQLAEARMQHLHKEMLNWRDNDDKESLREREKWKGRYLEPVQSLLQKCQEVQASMTKA